MIERIVLRATANGGRRDGVGISEVHFGRRHELAVLQLHQRHSVLAPELSEGISFGEPRTQPVAVARHRLRADGVQRHQDVIVPTSETADPVLGRTWSGVADQLRALRGSFDEHAEGLERECWHALFDLERNESGPRDTDVEAIVGRATRSIGEIVSRSGREPDMPVLGRRDLRDVGFVAADEPRELPARFCRSSDRQQEVPHHRHRVGAENEPLDVREFERRPSRTPESPSLAWGSRRLPPSNR